MCRFKGVYNSVRRPQTSPTAALKPHQIQRQIQDHPEITPMFQAKVTTALRNQPNGRVDIDGCLRTAWLQCTAERKWSQSQCPHEVVPEVSLKRYWQAKQQVRQTQQQVEPFIAPLVWHFADASARTVIRHFRRAVQKLRPLFRLWESGQPSSPTGHSTAQES